MADRLGRLAVLLVPRARPPVQLRNVVGPLVQQVRLQNVREEVVVAVPLAAVVERDQEQVPSIQRLEHGLAAVPAGNGIAERAAQPVQDGGLQQEVPDVIGLALQHLLDQVVDDVPVIPREAGDEAGDVVAPLHRQRRQLKRGDPPFGAPPPSAATSCAVRPSPITPFRYAAASSGVKRRSAARISTSSPRARNRASGNAGSARLAITRWICGGRCSSRNAMPVQHVARVDDVVVVEHQDDIVRDGAEIVEQSRQEPLRSAAGATAGARAHLAPTPGHRRLQRGDQVGPEQRGIVVALVEREPRHGTVHRHQRRPASRPAASSYRTRPALTPASAPTRPTAQAVTQSRTRDQPLSPPGYVELGLQQRARHDHLPSNLVSRAPDRHSSLIGRASRAGWRRLR